MIATAAFILFGGMLLSGALMTALTQRPSIAAMGVLVAIPGGSGICTLLGQTWLAFLFFAVSSIAIVILHRYLARGIARPGALPLWDRKAGRGLLICAALAAMSQIVFALFGVEILPTSLVMADAPNQMVGALTPSDPARIEFTLRDGFAVLLALPLVFVGFIASRALAEPIEPRTKDPLQSLPYRRTSAGLVPRHRER